MNRLVLTAVFFASTFASAASYTGNVQGISCSGSTKSCYVMLNNGDSKGARGAGCAAPRNGVDLRKFHLVDGENSRAFSLLLSAKASNQVVTVRGKGCGEFGYNEQIDTVMLGTVE